MYLVVPCFGGHGGAACRAAICAGELSPNKWLKRTPPSVTPPAGKAGRRRATLRLRRLATPLDP